MFKLSYKLAVRERVQGKCDRHPERWARRDQRRLPRMFRLIRPLSIQPNLRGSRTEVSTTRRTMGTATPAAQQKAYSPSR